MRHPRLVFAVSIHDFLDVFVVCPVLTVAHQPTQGDPGKGNDAVYQRHENDIAHGTTMKAMPLLLLVGS